MPTPEERVAELEAQLQQVAAQLQQVVAELQRERAELQRERARRVRAETTLEVRRWADVYEMLQWRRRTAKVPCADYYRLYLSPR